MESQKSDEIRPITRKHVYGRGNPRKGPHTGLEPKSRLHLGMEVLGSVSARVHILPVHRSLSVQENILVHTIGPAEKLGLEVGGVNDVQLHCSLDGLPGTVDPSVHLQTGVLLCFFPVGNAGLERVAVVQLQRDAQRTLLFSQRILQRGGVLGDFSKRGCADSRMLFVFGDNSQ